MKRKIKSLLLRLLAMVCRDDRPKVIYYHDIGMRYTNMGTPSDLFWAHMRCLRTGDKVCFDDGFRGLWDERDEFEQTGIRPTVFIAVDLVGKPGYLNWSEILELQRLGFVFECHSWSHQDLTQFDDERLWHEVYDSKVALGKKLGKDITEICFPVGYFNDKVLEVCRRAGYQKMYVSYPGSIEAQSDVVPRNLVQGLSARDVGSVLRGGLCPLRKHYLRQHHREVRSNE